ncbi:DsbA family protein [Gleimia hominis]|uniref:DsbA family protein n=1 Tax=Gleimia hominis TaxID=595468 RepID=UPI000C802DE7|nr:thioredoxin domain-containing protein [Gleimia hominis]WIK63850.1 thioredoxin domain-containing protein [Gleimia hominis]
MAASKGAGSASAQKARKMREQAQARERRTRNVIITVVVLLVLAVVAAVGVVVYKSRSADSAGEGAAAASADGSFIISANGSGKPKSGVPTLEEYMDYSCHACADTTAILGDTLTKAVKNGEFNLKITPVNTVDMVYHQEAADAAYVVWQQQPDKYMDFHAAVMAYFKSQFDAKDGSVIQESAQKSADKIAQIAKSVGISDATISKFKASDMKAQLKANTDKWISRKVDGSTEKYTPQFISNDKLIELKGESAEEVTKNLLEGIKAAQK